MAVLARGKYVGDIAGDIGNCWVGSGDLFLLPRDFLRPASFGGAASRTVSSEGTV
jgi:hypothetical protein